MTSVEGVGSSDSLQHPRHMTSVEGVGSFSVTSDSLQHPTHDVCRRGRFFPCRYSIQHMTSVEGVGSFSVPTASNT